MARPAKTEMTDEQRAAKKAAAAQAKAANFVKLAEKRMGNALKAIALVGALSNKQSYAYTPAQVDTLERALDNEVTKAINKFRVTGAAEKPAFSFGEEAQTSNAVEEAAE